MYRGGDTHTRDSRAPRERERPVRTNDGRGLAYDSDRRRGTPRGPPPRGSSRERSRREYGSERTRGGDESRPHAQLQQPRERNRQHERRSERPRAAASAAQVRSRERSDVGRRQQERWGERSAAERTSQARRRRSPDAEQQRQPARRSPSPSRDGGCQEFALHLQFYPPLRDSRSKQERAWARARYFMRWEGWQGRTLPEYLQIVLRIEAGVRAVRNAIAQISDNRRYGVKSKAAMLWHAALCVFVEDFYGYVIPTLGCPYSSFNAVGTADSRALFNDSVEHVIAHLERRKPLPDLTAADYARAWETASLLPLDAATDRKEQIRSEQVANVWPLQSRLSARGPVLTLKTKFGIRRRPLEEALSEDRMTWFHRLLYQVQQTEDEYQLEFGRETRVGWGSSYWYRTESRNPMLPRLTPAEALRELQDDENEVEVIDVTDAELVQAQRDLQDAATRNQKVKELYEIQNKKRALDQETARTEQLLKPSPRPQAEKRQEPLSQQEGNAEPRPAALDDKASDSQAAGSTAADVEDWLSSVSEPILEAVQPGDQYNIGGRPDTPLRDEAVGVYQNSMLYSEPVGANEYDPLEGMRTGGDRFRDELFTGQELEAGCETVLASLSRKINYSDLSNISDEQSQ